MRFAILGADSTTLALAAAVAAHEEHQVTWLCDLDSAEQPELAAALRRAAPGASLAEDWESLLDTNLVEGVIVARGSDEDLRAEQLRKLVQAGVPLMVAHPAFESMLVYYELDMIRRETGCVTVPYLPCRYHPAVQELAELVQHGPASALGKVEQVIIERQLGDRTKPQVLRQFTRDVDLIRYLCGDLTRIGAMGAASEELAYSSLGVQMSTADGVLARWSVAPADIQDYGRLIVLGAAGRAAVTLGPDDQGWALEMPTGIRATEFTDWDSAAVMLQHFVRAVAGEPVGPSWVDAARCVELAETIDRSLRKGRTVELYYEDYTEAGTFKGTMASLGCGLLLAGLGVLFLVALMGPAGSGVSRFWPYLLLGILGVFLILQLLTLLFRDDERGGRHGRK